MPSAATHTTQNVQQGWLQASFVVTLVKVNLLLQLLQTLQITVPLGMMLSLMTTTIPSLMTKPKSSLLASLMLPSLVMRTSLPILAFLSTMALRTTVLAPASRANELCEVLKGEFR